MRRCRGGRDDYLRLSAYKASTLRYLGERTHRFGEPQRTLGESLTPLTAFLDQWGPWFGALDVEPGNKGSRCPEAIG
jgi:hypothetical protein